MQAIAKALPHVLSAVSRKCYATTDVGTTPIHREVPNYITMDSEGEILNKLCIRTLTWFRKLWHCLVEECVNFENALTARLFKRFTSSLFGSITPNEERRQNYRLQIHSAIFGLRMQR